MPTPDKKIFKILLFWLLAIKSGGPYKARLVALGNLMKPGRDFDPNDTYCGNVSAVSIKIALSLASNFNLIMKGGDLKGAYLVTRSNPDYVAYIATPQGYDIPAGYVLVASGNLYGLQVAVHNFSKQFGICVALCGFIFYQYVAVS